MALTFLEIPVHEKEKAKLLGARWNSSRNRWFVPEGVDITPFKKWIPKHETEFTLRVMAPFYLLRSKRSCYKCDKETMLIAFSADGCEGAEENASEPIKFHYVTVLPEKLKNFIEKEYPNYYLGWSNTTRSFYYINHCEHCGAPFGDFFLHREPEGAFFPTSPDEASKIESVLLKEQGYVKLSAEASWGIAHLIKQHCKKTKYEPDSGALSEPNG